MALPCERLSNGNLSSSLWLFALEYVRDTKLIVPPEFMYIFKKHLCIYLTEYGEKGRRLE